MPPPVASAEPYFQLAVRLPASLAARLDQWRVQQPTLPTRAQAAIFILNQTLPEKAAEAAE